MIDLDKLAWIGLKRCLDLGSGERLGVITDAATDVELCDAICRGALGCGASVEVISLETTPLALALTGHEVLFILSGRSISYTPERVAAMERGARGISWNGMTRQQIARLIPVDYDAMATACDAIAIRIELARHFVLQGNGATLTFNGASRFAKRIDGTAHVAGCFSQIVGVANLAIAEGTAHGRVRAIGSVRIGKEYSSVLEQPLDIIIASGRIIALEGQCAHEVRDAFSAYNDPRVLELGVLGIGFHPTARLCGRFGEDERVAGITHLIFGRNTYHGGTIEADGRADICLLRTTLELNGIPLIVDGKLQL